MAKNPTLDALTEIYEYNDALRDVGRDKEAVPVSVVLSLGTGVVPVKNLKVIDVVNRPASIWEVAFGLKPMRNTAVDLASSDRVVERSKAWCSMTQTPYYRFDPEMSDDVPVDEKDDQRLINMMWETKAYMHANRDQVLELIKLLK